MRNIFSNYNKTVLCSLFYKSYSINSDENSKTKKSMNIIISIGMKYLFFK